MVRMLDFYFYEKSNTFHLEEIHAELIRTEQIVFGSMLEFFVEPSLFGLVKISVRLRNSYLIYK